MTPPDTPLSRFKTEVQAVQQAYCNVMAAHWEQVTTGALPVAEYWDIADGPLLADCGALIAAATTEYKAATRGAR